MTTLEKIRSLLANADTKTCIEAQKAARQAFDAASRREAQAFTVGQVVCFDVKGELVFGTILRANPKSVTVESDNGPQWRIHPALVRVPTDAELAKRNAPPTTGTVIPRKFVADAALPNLDASEGIKVSFKDEGGFKGPVTVTATKPFRVWCEANGVEYRGDLTLYPYGAKPDGQFSFGWLPISDARKIAAHYGVSLTAV